MAKKNEISYRPGTLAYYLRQAGYEPVEQPAGHPLWRKDGQVMTGQQAYYRVLEGISAACKLTSAVL